jgi:hypothetical protein
VFVRKELLGENGESNGKDSHPCISSRKSISSKLSKAAIKKCVSLI